MGLKVQLNDEGKAKITPSGKVQVICDGPFPVLFCDSAMVSISKCGLSPFFSPPAGYNNCEYPFPPPEVYFWCKSRHSGDGGGDRGVTCTGFDCNWGADPCDENALFLTSFGVTEGAARPSWWVGHCDADCETAGTASSVCAYQIDPESGACVAGPDYCTSSGDLFCLDCCCGYFDSFNIFRGCVCPDSHQGCVDGDPDNPWCPGEPCHVNTDHPTINHQYLQDEYTTGLLISNAFGILPGYSNNWICAEGECNTVCVGDNCPCGYFAYGQGCDCNAIYILSPDEHSLTLKKFQYLFSVGDPENPPHDPGCSLKWVERFVPYIAPGNTPDPDPDHWVDNHREYTFVTNEDGNIETQTPIFECLPPNSNGEITIQDVHWV